MSWIVDREPRNAAIGTGSLRTERDLWDLARFLTDVLRSAANAVTGESTDEDRRVLETAADELGSLWSTDDDAWLVTPSQRKARSLADAMRNVAGPEAGAAEAQAAAGAVAATLRQLAAGQIDRDRLVAMMDVLLELARQLTARYEALEAWRELS